MSEFIEVFGARQHNLKNIDVKIPKNKLVVITGISGSGKSSLAFDTLYAEGQRRYVESLSPYARQFLGVMDKPEVERITGLSPAIAIDQKAASTNPRSTVATATEIYDYLRLLFARIGHPHCPRCGREVSRQSPQQITDQIVKRLGETAVGRKPAVFEILSPVVRDRKGEFSQLFAALKRDGYQTVVVDNRRFDLSEDFVLIKTNRHSISVVIDRLAATKASLDDESKRRLLRSRLAEAVERATELSDGLVWYQANEVGKLFSLHFSCPDCNLSIGEIEPRIFSFNSPHGACPRCSGLGRVLSPDPEAEERIPNLMRRYLTTENESIRRRLARFIVTNVCPDCSGTRLKEEARKVTILGDNIAEVTKKTISQARSWVDGLNQGELFTSQEQIIARPLLKELVQRLEFLHAVGIDYLTLNRPSGSLAGGEAQRIQLASQIGTGLTGVLYVLDEPTIGLHQRDNARLIATLKRLSDLGNTIVVVEHDRETIESADWVIDLGPGAGNAGGKLVAEGTPSQIKANRDSLTGRYLAGRRRVEIDRSGDQGARRQRDYPRESIRLYGASQYNLKSIDVEFPLGKFICVTGVSGSGKSTLIHETLYHALCRQLSRVHHERPGEFDQLILPDVVRKVSLIDQSPIGRTPRSNPATYSGVFDHIRRLFALTREARLRGWLPGRFSFNVPGGRCETCRGQGQLKIEMQFLPDIFVNCEVCQGSRYNRETLEVNYKGKNIQQVLQLPVDEAVKFFKNVPTLIDKLRMLERVGLSYVELGQPAPLLSGGEAQRLKLTRELGKIRTAHTIYLLDEPTTGLHFADLENLITVLHDLVRLDNTVIVIEHNLEIVKNADWIIDLGPEGGERGGEVVAVGTPQEVAGCRKSYTGQYLKKILK